MNNQVIINLVLSMAVLIAPVAAEEPQSFSAAQAGNQLHRLSELEIPGKSTARPVIPKSQRAVLNFYTDRATFEAAAPGLPSEDFSNGAVAPGGVASCASPLLNGDPCFPGGMLSGVEFAASTGGMVLLGTGLLGNTSTAVAADLFGDTMLVTFTDGGVIAVGMTIHSNWATDTIDITIFDGGGGQIGTTTVTAVNSGGIFWGVTSDTSIGSINFSSPAGAGEITSDIQFGAPVPVTLQSFSLE